PFDSHYLSPVLTATSKLIGRESDGVVGVASANGQGMSFFDAAGEALRIETRPDLVMHLDHPEQILDAKIFKKMGATHTDLIQKEQREIYVRAIQATEVGAEATETGAQ